MPPVPIGTARREGSCLPSYSVRSPVKSVAVPVSPSRSGKRSTSPRDRGDRDRVASADSACFRSPGRASTSGSCRASPSRTRRTRRRARSYVPIVNTLLMIGCVALVIGFGSSAKLAGAYGLSVNGTMTATSIGFFFVMWRVAEAAGGVPFDRWCVPRDRSRVPGREHLEDRRRRLGAVVGRRRGVRARDDLAVGSAVDRQAGRKAGDAARRVPRAAGCQRGASRTRDRGVL